MRKSFIKIIAIALIVGLNWTGLSAIIETFAYFNDTAVVEGTTYTAGTLNLSLRSGQSNFVPNAGSMKPGDQANRDIYVGKTAASLALKHNVSFEFTGGDTDLCNQLDLKIWYDHYNGPVSGGYANRDMRLTYNGKLSALTNYRTSDFEIPHSDDQFDTDPSDGTEQWFYYSINVPQGLDSSYQNKSCQFKFVFKGWQTNLPDPSQGFTDTEEITNTIATGDWTSKSDIVLNEILPNPNGSEYGFDFGNDNSSKPQGEWVELYNNGSTAENLTGWYLADASNGQGNETPIDKDHILVSSPIIPGHGWLVVYMNKPIYNNTGDTVKLFDSNKNLIDSYSYGVDPTYCDMKPTPNNSNNTNLTGGTCNASNVPANKSFARIPDGIGAWVDPIPTPGTSNKLSEEEKMELGLLPLKEQIATTTTTTIPDSIPDTSTTTASTAIPDQTAISTTTVDFVLSPDTSTSTITEAPVEESTTTTTEPPVEEPDLITTTTTIPEETTTTTVPPNTTTTAIPEDIVTTTTTIPPIAEEVSAEEQPVIDELAVIEETPVTEEQPVIAPVDNNSGEQALPTDTSISGGDAGEEAGASGSEAVVSVGESSGVSETVNAAPSDGATE